MRPTCTSEAAIRFFESTGTMAGSRFWRELGNLGSAVTGDRQAWLVPLFRVSQWIRTETFGSRTAIVGASASWNVQFPANEWIPCEGLVASHPPPRRFQPLQLRIPQRHVLPALTVVTPVHHELAVLPLRHPHLPLPVDQQAPSLAALQVAPAPRVPEIQ